jgi:Meiotically up-regulated gene 113
MDDFDQLSLLPRLDPPTTGYIYALVGKFNTAVKFGYTNNTRRRGGEYRDGTMLCYWPGSRADEEHIHRELEPWRLEHNREWYRMTPEILNFLVNKCIQGPFPAGLRRLHRLQRDLGWGDAA